jgi:hypothetical protein
MTQDSTEERRRKHMAVMDDKRKIEALLPDDLYDSKDWRQGDMAERVLWLIAMLESKSEEVDAWVEIANKNVTKLDTAVAALLECQEEIDRYSKQEYPSDHPVHERYRKRDFDANPARIALAEINGE